MGNFIGQFQLRNILILRYEPLIKAWREPLGITQEELAARLGV